MELEGIEVDLRCLTKYSHTYYFETSEVLKMYKLSKMIRYNKWL